MNHTPLPNIEYSKVELMALAMSVESCMQVPVEERTVQEIEEMRTALYCIIGHKLEGKSVLVQTDVNSVRDACNELFGATGLQLPTEKIFITPGHAKSEQALEAEDIGLIIAQNTITDAVDPSLIPEHLRGEPPYPCADALLHKGKCQGVPGVMFEDPSIEDGYATLCKHRHQIELNKIISPNLSTDADLLKISAAMGPLNFEFNF